jgi:small nuclear ribonucleoprotein F
MLQNLINTDVTIRLKWNEQEITGKLVSIDSYMNIQLSGAEEWAEGKSRGALGQVLVRCNNVLWISARGKGGVNGDVGMED